MRSKSERKDANIYWIADYFSECEKPPLMHTEPRKQAIAYLRWSVSEKRALYNGGPTNADIKLEYRVTYQVSS